MTPSADTPSPLEALRITVHNLLHPTPPADDAHVASGCELFSDPTQKAPRDSDAFYAALDHVEAEGRALLQTESIGEAVVGFIIHEIGEHTVRPAAPAPHSLELAQALPLAREGDTLHRSEHAIVRAFMDVGDTLRHVYLNLSGLWVKA